jgi:outer membrane protein assembly factor BamB
VAAQGRVYVGSRDGFLYALDAASGQPTWRYDAQGSWVVGTPAVDGDSVYVGTPDTGLLLALDKRTGRDATASRRRCGRSHRPCAWPTSSWRRR